MPTPSIQTLVTDAQQVLNLDSISAVRSVVAVALANANTGTPLNPNLTTQQLWNEFYQVVTKPKSDIESIIANQLMKFLFAPPAPGGVGANGQVIFNDGGVLAGDPQFLWNKTANLLTVTGSATITGDLTVRTNKLFANATGVGVGTTSVFGDFNVQNSTNARCEIASSATGISYQVYDNARTGFLQSSIYASQHLWFNGVTEAMRLNSSGNVGIGVQPSAWQSNFKGLELGRVGNGLATYTAAGGAADLYISSNAYYNGGFKYANTGQTAGVYSVTGNVHSWYTAASGTAGTTITDFATAKMTLDASGNLLVAKTASGFTVAGAEIRSNGEVLQTIAASTDATIVSKVYSSTAAAYRFYVGLGGTVFATNTTISAISDARLKENVQDIDVGLGAILALKPRKFDWKAGKGKDIKGDRGFIAQEFEQVFPQLVDEWADPSPEGEAPYKSVRQDLIPVLVKAIQELAARVQTLETR